MLRELGHSYRRFEEAGMYFPLIELQCEYHAPARYDEWLELETGLERLTRARLDFHYRLRRRREVYWSLWRNKMTLQPTVDVIEEQFFAINGPLRVNLDRMNDRWNIAPLVL